jgi:drug/metabolite transporter (DMT)-like permease
MLALTHSNVRPYLALTIGVLALGASGIFVSLANAPGTVTGFYRVGIATAVLAIPFWQRRQIIGRVSQRAIIMAVLGGLFFAADLAFWNTGVLISGPTTPTFMGNTAPIWVGLGAILFFGEKLPRNFWLGLAVAMLGVGILMGIDALNEVGLGTFFGLLAGIFYGAYFLVMQRSRREMDAMTSFWLSVVAASVLLLAASLLTGQPLTGYSPVTYFNFLALGLLVQVVGQLAINYALGDLPASVVSPTLLAQPVLTAVISGVWLGETFTLLQLAGGAAVLTGVYVVHRSRIKKGGRSLASGGPDIAPGD